MKVAVAGLWHLGTVTAACLASAGHRVAGLDSDRERVENLRAGRPPVGEPGLAELIRRGIRDGHLSFSTDPGDALAGAEAVWVTHDTPVDDEDRADVDLVVEEAARLFPFLEPGALVLISSQVPVGTTRRLEERYAAASSRPASFAYLPENLRLGSAIENFTRAERIVAGVRNAADRDRVLALLRPFLPVMEWMTVESAEMTKHALNVFLASSIAFINEVASLCEEVGADALEVARGLKTDARIGARAYLSPGSAFAGGTLARDLRFLIETGAAHRRPTPLISGVLESNGVHRLWPRRTLERLLGGLAGKRVAVWGLTYKPGTDTLRRSASLDLCRWLLGEGAEVHAHDPAVAALPAGSGDGIVLHSGSLDALAGAEALLVATAWPEFRSVPAGGVIETMASPLVLDPGRFLADTLGRDPRLRYVTVGKGEA